MSAGSMGWGMMLMAVLLAVPAMANVQFTIMHFNDFHSRIDPDSETHNWCDTWAVDAGKCQGGIARMKTVIDQERAKGKPLLVLDAGDNFIGTLWDHHYKGKALSHFFNQLGITASTLGNHDFDYGPDVAAEYIKQLNHPVVSGNMNANGHYIGDHVRKYVVVDVNGHKVGICGSTTQSTQEWSKPGPVYMEDAHHHGWECTEELKRQGVNIIIMLSHNGYNADKYIARKVGGLDMVIGGHSHAFLYSGNPPAMMDQNGHHFKDHIWGQYPSWEKSYVDNRHVPVLQAGWGSHYMGRVEVEFDDFGNLVSMSGSPILLGSHDSENPVEEDPGFKQQIKEMRFW